MKPSWTWPPLSCMNWIFFSCTISRSASIAIRSRADVSSAIATRSGGTRPADLDTELQLIAAKFQEDA